MFLVAPSPSKRRLAARLVTGRLYTIRIRGYRAGARAGPPLAGPPVVLSLHTSTVFIWLSASARVLNSLLPTIVVVVVVGRCSTMLQCFVLESWTIQKS